MVAGHVRESGGLESVRSRPSSKVSKQVESSSPGLWLFFMYITNY